MQASVSDIKDKDAAPVLNSNRMEWLSNSIYESIQSNELGYICYPELCVQLDEKHIYVCMLHCCLIYWSKGIRPNACQEVDLESC